MSKRDIQGYLIVFLLLLVPLRITCGGGDGNTSAGGVGKSGYVTCDGAGVAGVVVTETGGSTDTTSTDRSGYYEINGISSGA